MAQYRSDQSKGLKFLRIRKVVTLSELATHLDCSSRTVQRRLADWQTITSYNQNSSYYTLPDIAEFDANGLWRYRGIFFSRFGNLSETFVQLVGNSQAGLTAAEAGTLLGLRPSSFLWSLRKHPSLRRAKHQGFYVYYSSGATLSKQQEAQRRLMRRKTGLPAAFEAIAILVEKIKSPSLSNEALSKGLKKQKLSIAPDMIENLFVKHDLPLKKTPHSG